MHAKEKRCKIPILELNSIDTWDIIGPNFLLKLPHNTASADQPNHAINSKISLLFQGNITNINLDAIVSPSNSHLVPGGGYNGEIHSVAGIELTKECEEIGKIENGKVTLTKGYNLPSKYVIHTNGPLGDHDSELLNETYNSILLQIDGEKIRTIALPPISTGLYGFPKEEGAEIALKSVRTFLDNPQNLANVDRIVFVVFSPEEIRFYSELMPIYFPLNT